MNFEINYSKHLLAYEISEENLLIKKSLKKKSCQLEFICGIGVLNKKAEYSIAEYFTTLKIRNLHSLLPHLYDIFIIYIRLGGGCRDNCLIEFTHEVLGLVKYRLVC